MLTHLQLVAYSERNQAPPLSQIPLTDALQQTLQTEWTGQLREFCSAVREVQFDAGYKPESDERFAIAGFILPEALRIARESVNTLDNFQATAESLRQLTALVVFAKRGSEEVVMIQRFTRSHIIKSGTFLFMDRDNFKLNSSPGLTLGDKLDAVYFPISQKLVFANFRNVNGILQLADFYKEASENDIRKVLSHKKLDAEDIDGLAINASQWLRTRFSMLKDSGVLDKYSPNELRQHATGFVDIAINGKGAAARIVFPADKAAAKRLLQFLNEELYKGPITDTLYETNSKRTAD
ncbi:MAG: DUF4868 domain-containing protein [Opitutaceae bacterium]|nr:DUF4868 domain-containing protein [Opitutaceae bacterium]